jgi:hypothetical protein
VNVVRLRFALFGLIIAPIVVAVVVVLFGDRWFPAGDMAQAELHMRGFLRHPPLVGAAGRIVSDSGFQGSHPGPSPWVAMLPVYLLGGRSSSALMAAAASVHIASIAWIMLLAWRRGGLVLAWSMAFGVLAVVRSAGTDFMIEPWNPWLALLPFIVFIFLILEIVDPKNPYSLRSSSRFGSNPGVWHLVLAIVVGSHCVQSHAGYALLVVPPLGLGLVLTMMRGSRAKKIESTRVLTTSTFTPLVAAVGTTFLIWLAPFIDQMRRVPGNFTILIQHFGSPSEPTIGLSRSWDILTSQLNVFGPWLVGPAGSGSRILHWLGFIGFILLFGSAVVISRRNALRSHVITLAVLAGFMMLGAVSIVRIFGPYYEYTVRWLWMMSATTIAVSVWTLVICLQVRPSRSVPAQRRSLGTNIALCGALTCVSLLSVLQVIDRVKLPGSTDSRILSGLIEKTSQSLDRNKTYQIRFYDPYTLNATGFGLALELERRGFDVKVDPEFAAAALPHRTAPMQDTDGVIWIVVGPALERANVDPSLTLIAAFNPRTEQQQARAIELLKEVERGLRAAGREDLVSSLESPGASILFTTPPLPEETAELVRELIGMGQPSGVFAMDVGDTAESLR